MEARARLTGQSIETCIARLERRVLDRLARQLPMTRWQRLRLNSLAMLIHLRNREFRRAWFQFKGIVRVLTGR